MTVVKYATIIKSDLIVMARPGRHEWSVLLTGSETQNVLTHMKTPVLVIR